MTLGAGCLPDGSCRCGEPAHQHFASDHFAADPKRLETILRATPWSPTRRATCMPFGV